MRIVIDMQGAQSESRYRGIGRYTLSLAKAVVRNREEHEIILVLNGLFPDTIEPLREAFKGLLPQDNIRVWYAPAPLKGCDPANLFRREVGERMREAFLATLEPDIVLLSSLFEGYLDDAVTSIGTFATHIPTAVVLYDLIPLLDPGAYLDPKPEYARHYRQKIEHLRRANLLLAISESTKVDVCSTLDWPSDAVVNISAACEADFQSIKVPESEEVHIKEQFGINRSFLLYCGGADPRKNVTRLIHAYAGLSNELRDKYQLVLAGKLSDGEMFLIRETANSTNLRREELLFTGHVTDRQLVCLYNLCTAVVFPSLYEGFGLPALEAMACGAPVIGSNSSSLPEVIGIEDALFDPLDTSSMTQKIVQVLEDDTFRIKLVEHCAQRAKLFSWDQSAARALTKFEQTIKSNRGHSHKEQSNSSLVFDLISAIATVTCHTAISDTDIKLNAKCIDLNDKNAVGFRIAQRRAVWQIEGPFDSSYSLALLNRETARALKSIGYTVVLHSTEGLGDFEADECFLARNPDLSVMYAGANEVPLTGVNIQSRNLYPPRVHDMAGSAIRMIHHYAWEETGLPSEWVDEFNTYLDGMTCLSEHVENILINHGVRIPTSVSGCGVDHWERIVAQPCNLAEAKGFRFLHVSSCFPRKGVEELLDAYGRAFSSRDDVTLVIKTFPNPHNDIQRWLDERRKGNDTFPHTILLMDELSEETLKGLYESCHVLVAPSRAEGFGLPMAEALLSGVPVITTAWGGQLEFCNRENSWLVDFEFEYAKSHFQIFSSAWVRVDIGHLADAMIDAHRSPQAELTRKSVRGRQAILERCQWRDVAERLVVAAGQIAASPERPVPRIGWLTTWNSKCGIAAYSKNLIEGMTGEGVTVFAPVNEELVTKDGAGSMRNWEIGKRHNRLETVEDQLDRRRLNTVIIQFNYGFYNHRELSRFIERQRSSRRVIIVLMHATLDPEKEPAWNYRLNCMRDSLHLCDRILVHSVNDLNNLKSIGLVKNVALIPHGIPDNMTTAGVVKDDVPTIGFYGFCLPQKGLLELCEAMYLLRKRGTPVRLRLVAAEHGASQSVEMIKKIALFVSRHHLEDIVETHHEFLSEDDGLQLLSRSDLLVFPYQYSGESTSAAVRYGLATGRPVAVTPVSIFDDLGDAVFRFEGTTPEHIADGIDGCLKELAQNTSGVQSVRYQAEMWRKEHGFSNVSRRLHNMIAALLCHRVREQKCTEYAEVSGKSKRPIGFRAIQ